MGYFFGDAVQGERIFQNELTQYPEAQVNGALFRQPGICSPVYAERSGAEAGIIVRTGSQSAFSLILI